MKQESEHIQVSKGDLREVMKTSGISWRQHMNEFKLNYFEFMDILLKVVSKIDGRHKDKGKGYESLNPSNIMIKLNGQIIGIQIKEVSPPSDSQKMEESSTLNCEKDLTQENDVYKSPQSQEQLKTGASVESNIWSIGVIMLEYLIHTHYFQEFKIMKQKGIFIKQTLKLVLNEQLCGLISDLLHQNPKERTKIQKLAKILEKRRKNLEGVQKLTFINKTQQHPSNCIGVVCSLFKKENKIIQLYAIGTLIGPNFVLTCAHIVYDRGVQQKAIEVYFCLGNEIKIFVKDFKFDQNFKNSGKDSYLDVALLTLGNNSALERNKYIKLLSDHQDQEESYVKGYLQVDNKFQEVYSQSMIRYEDQNGRNLLNHHHQTRKGYSGVPILISLFKDQWRIIGIHIGQDQQIFVNKAVKITSILAIKINQWINQGQSQKKHIIIQDFKIYYDLRKQETKKSFDKFHQRKKEFQTINDKKLLLFLCQQEILQMEQEIQIQRNKQNLILPNIDQKALLQQIEQMEKAIENKKAEKMEQQMKVILRQSRFFGNRSNDYFQEGSKMLALKNGVKCLNKLMLLPQSVEIQSKMILSYNAIAGFTYNLENYRASLACFIKSTKIYASLPQLYQQNKKDRELNRLNLLSIGGLSMFMGYKKMALQFEKLYLQQNKGIKDKYTLFGQFVSAIIHENYDTAFQITKQLNDQTLNQLKQQKSMLSDTCKLIATYYYRIYGQLSKSFDILIYASKINQQNQRDDYEGSKFLERIAHQFIESKPGKEKQMHIKRMFHNKGYAHHQKQRVKQSQIYQNKDLSKENHNKVDFNKKNNLQKNLQIDNQQLKIVINYFQTENNDALIKDLQVIFPDKSKQDLLRLVQPNHLNNIENLMVQILRQTKMQQPTSSMVLQSTENYVNQQKNQNLLENNIEFKEELSTQTQTQIINFITEQKFDQIKQFLHGSNINLGDTPQILNLYNLLETKFQKKKEVKEDQINSIDIQKNQSLEFNQIKEETQNESRKNQQKSSEQAPKESNETTQ